MRAFQFVISMTLLASIAYADAPDITAPTTAQSMLNNDLSARVPSDTPTSERTAASEFEKRPQRTGLVEYITRHFSGYEPVYFLAGSRPTAKFQLSFKYLLLEEDPESPIWLNPLHHTYFTYSQTSFWDLAGNSKPFTDNSYRPGLMLSYADIFHNCDVQPLTRLDVQGGYQHESNGQSGVDSRSVNTLFVRPIFTFGQDTDRNCPFIAVAPGAFVYILSLSDNPDIKDYRGHLDLRVVTGWYDGLQLATIARLGNDGNKGSLQFDFSYPLRHILKTDLYAHVQVFTGVGETLIRYRDSTSSLRAGISLVR